MRLLFASFLIAIGVLAFTGQARAGSVRVETRAGAVVGRGVDGAERWTIDHPGLRGGANNDLLVPVGPVTVGARTFYAVGADLLELDAEAGRILARRRLPARIDALATSDDSGKIHVTLGVASQYPPNAPDDRVEIEMAIDGAPPGRGYFMGHVTELWSALRDASRVVGSYDWENRPAPSAQFRDDAIAALEKQEKVDPTNPFLPAFRGYFLGLAGRADEAAHARAAAADLPAACFADLLRVSTVLEEDDAREAARRAFARGLDGFRASGVRSERVGAVLVQMVLLPPPRHAMARAIEAGDAARVDEMVDRAAALLPRAEAADAVFADFGAWLRTKGRADLAEKWEKRARVAATAPTPGMNRFGRDVDAVLPYFAGAVVATILAALVAGARASEKRRRAGRAPSFFASPRARDVLGVVLALALQGYLGFVMAARVSAIGLMAAAPSDLSADADAAPDVARWLASRPASRGRDHWLEVARAERAALEHGTRASISPPSDAEEREAIATVDVAFVVSEMSGPAIHPLVPLRLLAVLIATLFAYVVGTILGRWRAATRVVAAVVPGAPSAFAPFGGVALTIIVAACIAIAGADHILTDLATHSVGRYYGFPDLPHASTLPPRGWAYASLGALLVLHLVAAAVERSREKRAIPLAEVKR